MESRESQDQAPEVEQTPAAHFNLEADPADVPAWEQVESGRYMPRRIRGSCRGRALG